MQSNDLCFSSVFLDILLIGGCSNKCTQGSKTIQCCTSHRPKDRKSTFEPNLNGIYKMKGKVERDSDNVRNVGTFLFFITLDGLVFLAESLRARRTE